MGRVKAAMEEAGMFDADVGGACRIGQAIHEAEARLLARLNVIQEEYTILRAIIAELRNRVSDREQQQTEILKLVRSGTRGYPTEEELNEMAIHYGVEVVEVEGETTLVLPPVVVPIPGPKKAA